MLQKANIRLGHYHDAYMKPHAVYIRKENIKTAKPKTTKPQNHKASKPLPRHALKGFHSTKPQNLKTTKPKTTKPRSPKQFTAERSLNGKLISVS
jgi:hypothetical protein